LKHISTPKVELYNQYLTAGFAELTGRQHAGESLPQMKTFTRKRTF